MMLHSSCDGDAALAALAVWLHDNAAFLSPKLQVRCGGGLRGVYVKPDSTLDKDEVVASVPLRLMLTTERVLQQSPALADAPVRGTNLAALALLAQQAPGAFWQPYVAALPRNVSTTLVWTQGQLAELQASDLREHAERRNDAVARHWAALPHDVRPSAAAWAWALSMVWSRGHTVALPSGRQGALAPLADLFNFALAPSLAAAETEADALTFRAARPLRGDEEASVPYGSGAPLSNARLLMEYGFCVSGEHAHDDVALPLPAPQSRARADALRLLRLLPPQAPPPRLLSPRHATLPVEAVVYAQLATVIPAAHAASEAKAALADVDGFTRASARDGAVRRFLRAACEARLKEYATSATEDEALLAALAPEGAEGAGQAAVGQAQGAVERAGGAAGGALATSASPCHCAISVRRNEKRILHEWVHALRPSGADESGQQNAQGWGSASEPRSHDDDERHVPPRPPKVEL